MFADHIHMLLEIPPEMGVSSFMGYRTGKSSLMLYEAFGKLKSNIETMNFVSGGITLKQWVKVQQRDRNR